MFSLFRLYGSIALRNSIRSIRRSALTVGAIAFGLFCLIIFQGLKEGLRNEMVSSTLSLDTGTLQIHARGYESNLTRLDGIPELERVTAALERSGLHHYSLRLKAPALILAGAGSASVIMAGIIPESEKTITFVSRKIVAGSYLGPKSREKRVILMGQRLAQSLGLGVGDKVKLMAQSSFSKPILTHFTIIGLYQTSLASFDRTHVYVPLKAAQGFLEAAGMISEVAVNSVEKESEHAAEKLSVLLPGGVYQIRSWQQLLPDLQQIIELNDATMDLLIMIVFAIVALGIANTMTTIIFERFREIGTLAALGTTPSGIVVLISLESLGLGCIAAILGGCAGLAACQYLHLYGIDLSAFISNNHYFAAGHQLRADLEAEDFFTALAITLGTALLSGLYPAWKAARLDPVKAIGHT